MTAALAHRVDGQGEPLLLLNGGMMSIASWEAIAGPLAARFRVVRCDFRGQLLSPGQPHGELEGHAADVAALLDALGIARAAVIGTSFGAEVALLLAATRPERVAALVAATATDVATPQLGSGGGVLGAAWRAAGRGGDRREALALAELLFYSPAFRASHRDALDLRGAQAEALPPAWFASAAGLLAALENLDLRRYLGGIACPTLVLAAGLDRVMPPERSRALAAAIPGASLEVVEGSGHALVVEQPEEFVRRCLAFLDSVRVTGGAL